MLIPLFEDAELLFLSKPAGMPTVRSEKEGAKRSLQDEFLDRSLGSSLNKDRDYGFLNRLDNETTGIVVVAKNIQTFDYLRENWNINVQKIYRTIVSSKLAENDLSYALPREAMTIEFPIGHSPKSKKKMLVKPLQGRKKVKGDWQRAETTILKIHTDLSRMKDCKHLDLEVQIKTGVRHQIRAHLSTLGWPIVGDALYGGERADRLFLHAWKIKLEKTRARAQNHTNTLSVEAPLPSDWKNKNL